MKKRQVIIYAKPMLSYVPDNWDSMSEDEKNEHCKKLVEYNSKPEYDRYFDIRKEAEDGRLERLEKNCQRT